LKTIFCNLHKIGGLDQDVLPFTFKLWMKHEQERHTNQSLQHPVTMSNKLTFQSNNHQSNKTSIANMQRRHDLTNKCKTIEEFMN